MNTLCEIRAHNLVIDEAVGHAPLRALALPVISLHRPSLSLSFFISLSLSLTHTHTHTHMHVYVHTHTHTHTHTRGRAHNLVINKAVRHALLRTLALQTRHT